MGGNPKKAGRYAVKYQSQIKQIEKQEFPVQLEFVLIILKLNNHIK